MDFLPTLTDIQDDMSSVYVARLQRLYAEMDLKYDEAAEHYGFKCDGCKVNCCLTRFYHHTYLEYQFIRKGFENLDKDRPYIYIVNHQGYFDIFALLAGLRVDYKFILKKELMSVPILGYMMGKLNYISIDRFDIRKAVKSMDGAVDMVRSGTSILMFPEGTRTEDGNVKEFKKGAFQVALKSGCALVPIAISGSMDIVPKGSLHVNRGTIRLNIGSPIPVKGYTKKDITDLIAISRDTIINMMKD